MNDSVSLDEYLVRNPGFTYLMTVSNDSMVDAGILPNDLVIIDKLRTPRDGDVVAACVNDTWTLTYYHDDDPDTLGGVVVTVIKKYY